MANTKCSLNVVVIGRSKLSSSLGGKASSKATLPKKEKKKRYPHEFRNVLGHFTRKNLGLKFHLVTKHKLLLYQCTYLGSKVRAAAANRGLLASEKIRTVHISLTETKRNHLLEIPQLINGRAGIQTQAAWLQFLLFFFFFF